ncbi:1,4-dihydroxy-2-naphthoate octaprenyltransferase [compost metagenome]
MHTARIPLWLQSIRPGTLLMAFATVLEGTVLAVWQQAFAPWIALLALLTATSLQILTNLANDYGDVLKGCDAEKSIDIPRGLHTGQITPAQMRRALWLCAGLCAAFGGALVILACREADSILGFLLLGLLSIVAALTYTLGRHAYGYLGLGDLSVLLFFGHVGVIGTCFLQSGRFEAALLLPATATGLLGVALLNVNNLRDIESDPLSGKITLAVRLGPMLARYYHAAVLACALLCLGLFAAFHLHGWARWLFLLAAPMLYSQARYILRERSADAMRSMLGKTVQAAMLTHMLFVTSVLLGA